LTTKSPSYKPTDTPTQRTQAPSSSMTSSSSLKSSLPLTTHSSHQFETDDAINSPVQNGTPEVDEQLNFGLDESKFVVKEYLQPITFNMTVSHLSRMKNNDKLQTYFKKFIEEVLGMRSNEDWYPFHSKSMNNISIELVSGVLVRGSGAVDNDHAIPVQLIINGDIFVHKKKNGAETTTSLTRSASAKKKESAISSRKPSLSTFNDSFNDSILLYFTFWGAESLEQNLEEYGGLQDPYLVSVSVGEQELIAFGVDKDDNYMYRGDHDYTKPKHLPPSAPLLIGKRFESSTSSLKFGFLTTIAMLSSIVAML